MSYATEAALNRGRVEGMRAERERSQESAASSGGGLSPTQFMSIMNMLQLILNAVQQSGTSGSEGC
jgi:hypothetical protein